MKQIPIYIQRNIKKKNMSIMKLATWDSNYSQAIMYKSIRAAYAAVTSGKMTISILVTVTKIGKNMINL